VPSWRGDSDGRRRRRRRHVRRAEGLHLSISLVLEMAASNEPDREAVIDGEARLTAAQLYELAKRATGAIAASDTEHVVYVGTGGFMVPLLMFASALSGRPFSPLNYRLSNAALRELIDRLPASLVVADDEYASLVAGAGRQVMRCEELIAATRGAQPLVSEPDPDSVAVVLFTSGTTSQPKAVQLTHNNLTSYVTGTVEFASAERNDAALICVPPYHIAGVGAALSNLYAGRTMVYLRQFDPHEWVRLVIAERITTATVVPTMLDRIVALLDSEMIALPTLQNLAYGGSKVALPLVRKALYLLPEVGFVNAYGLTETSSTIAVLTPADHRVALRATHESVARRLGSVGRPVPGIEIEIRGEDGGRLGPDETGELFVRGPQVSGRYSGIGSVLDADGWFATKDLATIDEDGYLFVVGRGDDTIIRGGENIAPAEVEDVLVEHPDVRDVAVVGVDDLQWGQIIVAVVVPVEGVTPDPDELREHVRRSLRSSRTPDRVVFRDHLPANTTGKVLRRQLVEELQPARVESRSATNH
jgi:acyl-CoA synthetase (AMP-forming)/AMP-acid ligase II